ncbi:hypothetical protein GMRT_12673 [Giardia muris]|uniref:Uncharacterized protein n=1 Tax=Giardia muris TaxID=5742 RepID=A0A4Z1SSA0_GIAMU|nr:hypothetical protein GMRT_12673 [Giardia muris]|eukprot:TNJ27865.1 hypothetical protein GMRT_12673 [Giardia muris]
MTLLDVARMLGETKRWTEAFIAALTMARREGLSPELARIVIHAGLHAPVLRSAAIMTMMSPLFEAYLKTSARTSTTDPSSNPLVDVRALFEMTVYCVEVSLAPKELVLLLLETVDTTLKEFDLTSAKLGPSQATLLLGYTLDFTLWLHGWLTCDSNPMSDPASKSRRFNLLRTARRLGDQLTIYLDGCVPLSMELAGMLLWEPDGIEGQFDGLRGIYTHLRELTLLATPAPSQTDTYISPEALSTTGVVNGRVTYGFDQGAVALALLAGAVHALSADGEVKLEPQDIKELQKYALAALSVLSASGGRRTRHSQRLECLFYFNVYKYYYTAREDVIDTQDDVAQFLTSQDELMAVCRQKIMSLPFLGVRDGVPQSDMTSEDESSGEGLLIREECEEDEEFGPFDTPLTWFSIQLGRSYYLDAVRMASYLVSSELRICTRYDGLSTLITSLSSLLTHYTVTVSSAPYVLENPLFQAHWRNLVDTCFFSLALHPFLYDMLPYALSDDLLDQISHSLKALSDFARPQLLEYEARACLSKGRELLNTLSYAPTYWEQQQILAIDASPPRDWDQDCLAKKIASCRARSYTHYYLLRRLHDHGIMTEEMPLPSESELAALSHAYAALGVELCVAARRVQ